MSFLVSLIRPLAYVSLPVILVRQVAVSSTIGRYYARVIFYVGTLFTVACGSVFIAAGLTLVGRSTDTNYFVARIFYTIISRGLDLHIKIEGEEHLQTTPTVLMVNHQSILDILVIGRYVSCYRIHGSSDIAPQANAQKDRDHVQEIPAIHTARPFHDAIRDDLHRPRQQRACVPLDRRRGREDEG